MSDWLDDIPRIATAFVAFVKTLRIGQPGRMTLCSQIEELDMPGFWKCDFNLPPYQPLLEGKDVVSREVLITVDGVERDIVAVGIADAVTPKFGKIPEGGTVLAQVRDLDDATDAAGQPAPNRGEWSLAQPMVILDTVAPGQPGMMSVATQEPDDE